METQTRQTGWPSGLTVAQVRVARPTGQLAEIETFYSTDLGLPVLYRFEDHAGYNGVMIGLPGTDYHLEFTSHVDGSPCPAPTTDNLLVLFHNDAQMYDVVERLAAAGHERVEAENPYWGGVGALTFEDPDGWRLVLGTNARVLDQPVGSASSDARVATAARSCLSWRCWSALSPVNIR
jgi:catechol 2,3-dioxygenase-like lactoylglutathione lyase family enzyme